MTEPAATAALLAAVGILPILAGLASPLSNRLGVPVLVAFLGLGMLAGSEGIGGRSPASGSACRPRSR